MLGSESDGDEWEEALSAPGSDGEDYDDMPGLQSDSEDEGVLVGAGGDEAVPRLTGDETSTRPVRLKRPSVRLGGAASPEHKSRRRSQATPKGLGTGLASPTRIPKDGSSNPSVQPLGEASDASGQAAAERVQKLKHIIRILGALGISVGAGGEETGGDDGDTRAKQPVALPEQ